MFCHKDGMRYYVFESLEGLGVTQAIFTRQGGVSPKPWDSLNVGGFIGDDLERVIQNRARSFHALGREPDSVYDVWQVHSAEVVCTSAPRQKGVDHLRADAILTDNPRVTLFMRFADCVPILLCDPEKRVVGLVHAGWQGTVKKIVAATVAAMIESYGSQPGAIWAGIGPSIGPHHYTVGPEVIREVRRSFGEAAPVLLQTLDDGVQFDLWTANRLLLEQAGVRQIEVAGLCTACHPEDWYSHRGERGRTGRFGALIASKE